MMITDHVLAVRVPTNHATSCVTGPSRPAETWKIAEILIMRHHLTVPQRQLRCPKLNWADRSLLATLLSVIPKARR